MFRRFVCIVVVKRQQLAMMMEEDSSYFAPYDNYDNPFFLRILQEEEDTGTGDDGMEEEVVDDVVDNPYKANLDHTRRNFITFTIFALLSTICSIAIIVIVMRSHVGLSSVYHRILVMLCVADVASSLAQSFSTLLVPKETNYYIWGAKGTTTTCDMQGFLIAFGFNATSLYNASLCIYYLAVIKLNWSEEFIKKKMELYLHLVPIIPPLTQAILSVIWEQSNPSGVDCAPVSQYWPPHCVGYEPGIIPEGYSIPCGKGKNIQYSIYFISYPAVIAPILTIAITMPIIYKTVAQVEARLQRYGEASIIRNSQLSQSNHASNHHLEDGQQQSQTNIRSSTLTLTLSPIDEQQSSSSSATAGAGAAGTSSSSPPPEAEDVTVTDDSAMVQNVVMMPPVPNESTTTSSSTDPSNSNSSSNWNPGKSTQGSSTTSNTPTKKYYSPKNYAYGLPRRSIC